MPLLEVRRGQGAGFGNYATPGARMTTMGELVVVDKITAWLLDGRMFQVRGGTVTTPLSATSGAITTTAAEMCVDAVANTTIMPVDFHIALREVATALTAEFAIKAINVVSSAGTAFVPLPLYLTGTAAVSTARVQSAGNVTVTAELATNTRRLWEYTNNFTEAPTTINGNLAQATIAANTADLLRYVGIGPSCIYFQAASATAAVAYYETFNYAEFPTLLVQPS